MKKVDGQDVLNLTGLVCPMPIIKLKKYLAQHASEKLALRLVVNDKGALKDIPAFCQQQKLHCELVSEDDEIVFDISR